MWSAGSLVHTAILKIEGRRSDFMSGRDSCLLRIDCLIVQILLYRYVNYSFSRTFGHTLFQSSRPLSLLAFLISLICISLSTIHSDYTINVASEKLERTVI